MRVLHVCDSIIGGTGSYLAELLLPQAANGEFERVVLLMPRQHLGFLDDGFQAYGANGRVQIVTFERRTRLLGMMMLFFAYLKLWFRLRPNVVHAHSFGAGVATRLLPLPGSRIVYCPHGWSFNMKVGRVARTLLGKLEYCLSLVTDAIILISQHELDSAEKHGISGTKMHLIRSGIRRAAPDVLPATWDDHRTKFLFVGRFDEQKGVDILLKAIAPLGDRACLRLIGASVVGESRNLQFPDCVEQVGWLDRDGVAAQMKACDAVVVPSRWEGFGLVALEAMRLGKPVLASAVGGLAETLDNGNYGVSFEPENVEALRRQIATLTPERIERIGKIGHQRFLESYTSETMVDGTAALYRSLVPCSLGTSPMQSRVVFAGTDAKPAD